MLLIKGKTDADGLFMASEVTFRQAIACYALGIPCVILSEEIPDPEQFYYGGASSRTMVGFNIGDPDENPGGFALSFSPGDVRVEVTKEHLDDLITISYVD